MIYDVTLVHGTVLIGIQWIQKRLIEISFSLMTWSIQYPFHYNLRCRVFHFKMDCVCFRSCFDCCRICQFLLSFDTFGGLTVGPPTRHFLPKKSFVQPRICSKFANKIFHIFIFGYNWNLHTDPGKISVVTLKSACLIWKGIFTLLTGWKKPWATAWICLHSEIPLLTAGGLAGFTASYTVDMAKRPSAWPASQQGQRY